MQHKCCSTFHFPMFILLQLWWNLCVFLMSLLRQKVRKSFFTLPVIPVFREFLCSLAYSWIMGISPYLYGLHENSMWLGHRTSHLNSSCHAIIGLTRLSVTGTLPLSQSWYLDSWNWWELVTCYNHKTDFICHNIFLYFSSLHVIFPILHFTGSFKMLNRKKQYFE